MRYLTRQNSILLLGVVIIAAIGYLAGTVGIHATSTPSFCTICHEMRIVAEQGWMRSPHYQNSIGIIATCKDCHIPPELLHMFWTKARDGTKDIITHLFGEAEPVRMDWAHLSETARRKIADSSCMTCHANLTPKGAPIKKIIAHRAYLRMQGRKKCINCHTTEFHGKFKEYLFERNELYIQGGYR